MRFDRIKGDKLLKMARAIAAQPKRRKNPQHSRTKGYIAGLEEALRLGSPQAIEATLNEAKARLAAHRGRP